jgi:proline iminopeptidase
MDFTSDGNTYVVGRGYVRTNGERTPVLEVVSAANAGGVYVRSPRSGKTITLEKRRTDGVRTDFRAMSSVLGARANGGGLSASATRESLKLQSGSSALINNGVELIKCSADLSSCGQAMSLASGTVAAIANGIGNAPPGAMPPALPAQEPQRQCVDSQAEQKAKELTVKSGPVSLNVEAVGGINCGCPSAAPVLLAINGGPGLSHDYMAALARLASSGVRVVFYDQRGTGKSTRPGDPALFRFEDYVADVEAIRMALGVESMHLLGHSWGGGVALAYAASHPSRVSSLTLIDNLPPTTAGFLAGRTRLQARQSALTAQGLVPNPVPVGEGDDCSPMLLATLPVYFADPRFAMPKEFAETACSATTMSGSFNAAIASYNFNSALKTVTAPTQILFGDSDPYGLEWQSETTAALSAASPKVTTIAGAGHYPWMDRPDATFDALEAFYASLNMSDEASSEHCAEQPLAL